MGRRSKSYADFKKNAIAFYNEEGRSVSDIENSLGISQGQISRWKNQLENNEI